MADLTTIVDSFSGSEIDAPIWSPQGVCYQLDGLIMPLSETEANHVLTDSLYTFTEVVVNFAQLPNLGNGSTTAAIELVAEGFTAQAGVIWNNNFIQIMLDFVWEPGVAFPAGHYWWKMALVGSDFVGYTSADGITWVEFDRVTAPAWMSANVLFRITPGYYAAETDPGYCIVGGVNINPESLPTQSPSIGPATTDLINYKLGAGGYTGSINDRLYAWKEDEGLLSWGAYQTHILANTTTPEFVDAEREYWLAFA